MMTPEKYISLALALRTQIHVFHWQTKSYAEHKALDAFYTEMLDILDEFVETYQGRYPRIKLSATGSKTENYSKGASTKHLEAFVKANDALKKKLGEKPSDLQNILDEMIGLTQKTIYLLSLS